MTLQPSRVRKCANCHEPFAKRNGMQKVCSPSCAAEYVKSQKARQERKEDRARKEALKTRKHYLEPAQKVANKYARVRDAHLPCISCGKPAGVSEVLTGGGWDGGHYRSVGSAAHLRFDLRNIHSQCKHCNHALAGNHVEYRKGLVERKGVAFVEALEADQTPRKHDAEWLKRFIAIFRRKTRRLEKRRGK